MDGTPEGDSTWARQRAQGELPMAERVNGRWRFVWVWAAIWLVYLLGPLGRAWDEDDPARRAVGVASVLLFGVVFIVAVGRVRSLRRADATVPRWLRLGSVATMVVLTALTSWAIGQNALGMLVYVAVVGLFMLNGRPGLIFVAALLTATILVPLVVPGWKVDYTATFSVFISAVAMWGILQIIQRNSQLAAAREDLARLAVVEERSRLARDLHDILGHSLTVVAVKAELAGRLVAIDPAKAEAEMADVQRLARQALTDVRAAVAGFREVTLATELVSARAALAAAGIDAEVANAIDGVAEPRRELFGWVVREGVTNVIRHSGAARCRISVSHNEIEVADDGKGPGDADGGGHGLTGLRERVVKAGGGLFVGRSSEGGFSLRVRLG